MRRVIVVLFLLAATAAFAQGQPNLVVEVSADGLVVPALRAVIQVRYFNVSTTVPATDTVVTITSTQPFVEMPGNCTVTGTRATCNAGTVPPSSGYRGITVTVRAPEGNEQPFGVTAEISSREGDSVPSNNLVTATVVTEKAIFVTTVADSGPGSLREAINTANASCEGDPSCVIAFRIPNTTAPWVTIVTATPLPHITGSVLIEGGTQTRFFGDTNPAGPEVELTGVANREGHGLVYRGCGEFSASGLTINGFPGSGVYLTTPSSCRASHVVNVSMNYIGTDSTGMHSVRNQRGVSLDGLLFATITGNVISGNMRSGVYVEQGQARVESNRIGLTREGTPLGNGASGVYVGVRGSGTDLSANSIGFNAHWGIAIDASAGFVSATGNSMQGNFGLGIDWGHDMNPLNGPFAAPEITSARVENGQTIIEGTNPPNGVFESEVHVYASDAPHWTGYGEGEDPLGFARVSGTTFRLTVPGDLRGRWVTATFTYRAPTGFARSPRDQDFGHDVSTTTSEYSRAVLVQ